MIDFHSHILPGIDDGSADPAESIALLQMQREQGADTVVATPHFYPERQSPDSFLRHRAESAARLKEKQTDGLPEIRLGAEVAYYDGISRMDCLTDFCIEGSRTLLVEMPFSDWTEYMMQELIVIRQVKQLSVVLAHIERYLPRNARWLDRLTDTGIWLQSNASFFRGFWLRKACAMLKKGQIHLLGSDCHNLASRPPLLADAIRNIRKYAGEAALDQMDDYGQYLLGFHDE